MATRSIGNKNFKFGDAYTKTGLHVYLNPMQTNWLLCNQPAGYKFSSAIFYEQKLDEFGILTNFSEVF